MTKRLRALTIDLLLAAVLAIVAAPARADSPGATQQEWALLPQWCAWTQQAPKYGMSSLSRSAATGGPNMYEEYVRRYGDGWTAMHHYCWALVDIIRMGKLAGRNRAVHDHAARRALGNLDYVLQSSALGFAFRPDVLASRARLLIRMNDYGQASQTAQMLILESPSLPDGYVLLAEVLLKAGRSNDASAVLARGDEAVTDKERYAKMRSTIKLK